MTLAEQIAALRQENGTSHDRQQAILTEADSHEEHPGQLTAEQAEEFDNLEAQIEANNERIEQLEADFHRRERFNTRNEQFQSGAAVNRVPAEAATPHIQQQAPGDRGTQVTDTNDTPVNNRVVVHEQQLPPGTNFVRMCRVIGATHGNREEAIRLANSFGYNDIALAMGTAPVGDGGFAIPTNYVPDLIELLRPRAVLRSLGVRTPPLVNGNMTLPRLTGGSTANYTGENVNIPPSQLSGDQLQFQAKKLTVLVPLSNELLRWSDPSAESMIREDIVQAVATKEDIQFIRGTGSQTAPTSIDEVMAAGNKIVANPTVNLQNVDLDLNKCILALLNADVMLSNPAWIFAPRTWAFLESLRDGNGNRAYPELRDGMLKGYPIRQTSQVPTNLGVGTDESEIYFANSGDLVIAQDNRFEVSASNTAAYHDGANVVAAFSLDQTVLRLITHHDFNIRHPESAAKLEQVTWGA